MRILLLTYVTLASCAVGPTMVKRNDGTLVVSTGWQIFEDSATEQAEVIMPDGTKMLYAKTGKSQSKVPLSAIRTYGTIRTAEILDQGLTDRLAIPEKGMTQRAAIDAGVDKARIQADVIKKTFVPHAP